jgi:hypothetical protein
VTAVQVTVTVVFDAHAAVGVGGGAGAAEALPRPRATPADTSQDDATAVEAAVMSAPAMTRVSHSRAARAISAASFS